jgi:poly-gamma-glutamate system protein
MRLRQGKVNRWVLVVVAVLALAFFYTVTKSARTVRSRLYDPKLASARLAAEAFGAMRAYRERLGVPIDSVNDPNRTGLVGLQYSQTTYGRSDLSDALTTTNPNFSAAIVEMLYKAGVRKGDVIAVSWDGTYPALNIELLAAAKTLDLRPVIVTAQSAGMWGANQPGMSWLDIERALVNAGLWGFRTRFATLGGETDDGRGLSPEGRMELAAAAESAGVELVVPSSVDDGVARRAAVFDGARVLVSVGRPVANVGNVATRVPSRIISDRTRRNQYQGLIGAMRHRNVPVIHIANPSQVALDYRLPLAPAPMPETGKGRLFYERRYSVALAALFSVILLLVLGLVVRYDVEGYLGVGEDSGEKEAV